MVSEIIANWYKSNSRDLPWRTDSDPYHVWVSEIILQQTRVNQGVNYYNRFLQEFPTIFDLANAPIDRLMRVWQGLGYYSRARNMHYTAKYVVEHFRGVFPDNIDELLKLKGIGDYSAAALISIAYNKPYAAVDGNVYRFLSRYYGIDIPINTTEGKKYFKQLADDILDRLNPGQHNQAVMEMGALVCTPTSPRCSDCPLSDTCIAYNKKIVSKLPVKMQNKKVSKRYFYYMVIFKSKKSYIRQRAENDIWALLYEFPLIETSSKYDPEKIMELAEWKKLFPHGFRNLTISKEFKHQLSHRLIYLHFFTIEVEKNYSLPGYLLVDIKDLDHYAFPVIIERFLKQIQPL